MMILFLGAFLGLTAMIVGAILEHGFGNTLSDDQLKSFMTALRYNQLNAVIIALLGLFLINGKAGITNPFFKWSSVSFVIGTVFFCFGIYLSYGFDLVFFVYVTPLGGVILMLAWILLCIAALREKMLL